MVSMTTSCCTECGADGGASLKTCKSCMLVKYCNAACQMKHWPAHKTACKLRAAELRDDALFKDPPAKEDCSICFLPMPILLISCATLPPVTISSIPIYVFAKANEMLAKEDTEEYYPCCGKTICRGCLYSNIKSGNYKCPFCNAERIGRTDRELVADMRKRVAANDAASICMLAGYYYQGLGGVQQDHIKAIELFTKSADLGSCRAHYFLAKHYNEGGEMKKAKFHLEASAMAGNEIARNNLGTDECNDGNIEQAVKHWIIGASAGGYHAMHNLRLFFEKGLVSRDTINSTLAAYNSSCAEMRSEARDTAIRIMAEAD